MYKYIIKRLLLLIPVLLGVVLIVFFIMYINPNDITELMLGARYTPEASAILKAKLGIDQPFFVQFFNYIKTLLHGSFGNSYFSNEVISEQIAIRLPYTVKLALGGILFVIVLSIPIGIYAAIKPNSFFSAGATIFALAGLATPSFWLGMMMILLFSVKLGWLPAAGMDTWKGLILPMISVGCSSMAGAMRTMRASMQESVLQDYVRTARSKGLKERDVIWGHCVPNALLPTVTVIGMELGYMFGGSVLVESVFSIPGIGRYMVQGLQRYDTPIVLACIIILGASVGISALLIDIVYALIDPRIRAKYASGGK